MFLLKSFPITTAQSLAQQGNILLPAREMPLHLTLFAVFAYGSGGTTANAYVQSSYDGGATYWDIANFSFTTASAEALFNLSALTPVTTQDTTFTSGSLASNTCKDGHVGDHWQVKVVTTGTYAGGTTLSIYALADKPLKLQTIAD